MAVPYFSLGHLVATSGALALLGALGENPADLLVRHQNGVCSEVSPEEARENELSVLRRLRILSSYQLGEESERVWIIIMLNVKLNDVEQPRSRLAARNDIYLARHRHETELTRHREGGSIVIRRRRTTGDSGGEAAPTLRNIQRLGARVRPGPCGAIFELERGRLAADDPH